MSHCHIDVENVNFSYEKGVPVLKNISFHAGENESIALIGANGTGKSTLLKLIVGLEENFTGSIRVEEIPVGKKTISLVREKVGYVFQDSESQLFMSTVFEDVAFGPRNYGLPEDEVVRRTEKALADVGILHLRNKPIYKMSGGEKKSAAIATILSMHPDIVLMDEPSAALDPKNRRNLIRILNDFDHLKILTTHDLDLVLDTCERTILMKNGEIVFDGPTEEIMHNEALLLECDLELPLRYQK